MPPEAIVLIRMTTQLEAILSDCGISGALAQRVHGGDINESYRLQQGSLSFFLKVNEADRYPGMFAKEKSGLDALREAGNIRIPSVLGCGVVDDTQYLLLEWMQPGNPTPAGWERFGAELARMHARPGGWFGWEEDNYIGSLVQINSKKPDWGSFYIECRILPLVKRLCNGGTFGKKETTAVDRLAAGIGSLYPAEPSSLLHGDLWSGNYLFTDDGQAALIDPAVYRGHREMDLAMSLLFGGFDPRFYAAYEEIYPLEKGWKKRVALSQLYPLLVHAVLFGGHYVAEAREVLEEYCG